MKKVYLISKTILASGILIMSLGSCKNETKQEDPKEVAEDQNEAKFDSIESKENDSDFLIDATEINLTEIEMGKLAEQKSTNVEIKKLGKMLVEEHMASNSEIKTMAASKNYSIPTSITKDGLEEFNQLKEKTGVDFDKKFVNEIIDHHQKAIDEYSKAAERAADPEVKAWASKNVSSLTAHIQHAKMLKQDLDKK